MGITIDNFFEKLYNVLFAPKNFFETEETVVSTRLAFFIVVFITIINKCCNAIIDGEVSQYIFVVKLLWRVFASVFVWLFTAFFFEYTAKIFNCGGKLKEILFYTAFATAPCLFFPIIILIKNLGILGYILGSILGLLLYFWLIFLFALSIRAAYKISYARSFMLIFLPAISIFFALYWPISSIIQLRYIFSV